MLNLSAGEYRMRTLERLHPVTSFLYIVSVLAVTIFTRNPVLLAESLAGGAAVLALSGEMRRAAFIPAFAAVIAVTNPIFSHNGVTVLFFVGDIAFTLEALIYGLAFGIMLSAAVLWGVVSSRFVTSDKYVWLFGRILPAAGLVLSCALRFVPLFIRRTGEYISVRRAENGGRSTLRLYLSALSSSMGYSAEEAMTSAVSMRARGYGTARRTFFSRYRLTMSEIIMLSAVGVFSAAVLPLMISGAGTFYYYPAISELPCGAADLVLYIAFGLLCAMPSAVIIREKILFASADRERSACNADKC